VGHYRVLITPKEYERERIASLGDLWKCIEETRVRLRGWDYPHLGPRSDERGQGQNYVESWCSWTRHLEYWRFFQSGQFVHLFSFRENDDAFAQKIAGNLHWLNRDLRFASGYLSITSTIWTMSELYEFAARLASRGVLELGGHVTIEMKQIRNRVLGFSESDREVHELYRATTDDLSYAREHTRGELLSAAKENAVECSGWFFERFGATFPRSALEDIQDGLYKLR
jgi:hypothetical protein